MSEDSERRWRWPRTRRGRRLLALRVVMAIIVPIIVLLEPELSRAW